MRFLLVCLCGMLTAGNKILELGTKYLCYSQVHETFSKYLGGLGGWTLFIFVLEYSFLTHMLKSKESDSVNLINLRWLKSKNSICIAAGNYFCYLLFIEYNNVGK